MNDGSWKPGFKSTDDTFEQEGFCETSAAVTTFFGGVPAWRLLVGKGK